ncbi:MAG: hypothetical protein AB2A00_28455 [Myxococcota bacterium]
MSTMRCILPVVALLCACPTTTTSTPQEAPRGDGFSSVYTLDERTVLLSFTRKVDGASVQAGAFEIADRTVVPFVNLPVESASASGPAEITLTTGPQEPGRTYTLKINGLKDEGGYPLDGTLNFTGGGAVRKSQVTITLGDAERALAWGPMRLEISANPSTGAWTESLHPLDLTVQGAVYTITLELEVNPRRTADRRDDLDPVVDRRAYAVRAVVIEGGQVASPLFPFEVTTTAATNIVLPLFEPPEPPQQPGGTFDPPEDPNPGDGLKRVRLIVDDRQSGELVNPQLKASFTAGGDFDVTFPQTLTLEQPVEARFYEVTVDVKVDPNRRIDGTDENTLPYIIYLVNNGVDVDAINVSVVAPDETPEAVVVPLGDPSMTPVTFRVDVGAAFLTADGTQRGVFDGESVWLTGEWQIAADVLGRNAGDAFTGGEQSTLEMREDSEHPGVWTKTLWLPGGRPYGWKAVRCQIAVGCGPLNQRVASSGRAFATVMKNLVTENQDAFAVPAVVVVDPHNLSAVPLSSGNADYSNASVYIGNGEGGEDNPPGMPNPSTLFKQESPDLAVVVGDEPVRTPIYVVGTWRDINLPMRPADILNSQETVNLSPYDYDEGFIGRYPPSRSEP